ncbi:hypothetical protein [Ferrimonas pelagia]|uniref:Uncharacterized protein n=1 Tax=Ferrimonas pelagia TaxID=1177826 RepID=A0ABP9FCX3_9GAMM
MSSLLFIFIPAEGLQYGLPFASKLPIIGFGIGALCALLSANKYELRMKFNYGSETGQQWLTVAKSRKQSDLPLFQTAVNNIEAAIK